MQCIVFTNSLRLAAKYRASQQDVLGLLNKNLQYQQIVEFLFLDVSDYQDEFGEKPTWQEHKAILADFMAGMGLSPTPSLSLFIVGGDDVIPMPKIPDPISETDILQADILYCFTGEELTRLDVNDAICNVGRLPLESGSLPSTLNDDLQSYFNLSNMMLTTGIEVNKVVMTSTESWMPASNDMIKGLPVEEPPHITNATNGYLFVSPRLSVEDTYVVKHYQKEISQADMLMFNLHGNDTPGYSSFYGEGLNGHNTPEAFSCDMFRYSGARIFNTVACYGGRYIGYSRNDSMLMSALYGGGVVLYAGSCTRALGRSGQIHHVAQDALMPSGYSESFMKLYSLYLFKGITAGEAFLSAKCDYFNLCRSIDSDECALATVLMFNLYGMPVLNVNSNYSIIQEARGVKEIHDITPPKNTTTKVLYDKNLSSSSVLTEVRMRVNDNLQKIRKSIESNLYTNWGLNPADLDSIVELTNGNQKSLRFEYESGTGPIKKRSWAFVDDLGNVKDVIHFKN